MRPPSQLNTSPFDMQQWIDDIDAKQAAFKKTLSPGESGAFPIFSEPINKGQMALADYANQQTVADNEKYRTEHDALNKFIENENARNKYIVDTWGGKTDGSSQYQRTMQNQPGMMMSPTGGSHYMGITQERPEVFDPTKRGKMDYIDPHVLQGNISASVSRPPAQYPTGNQKTGKVFMNPQHGSNGTVQWNANTVPVTQSTAYYPLQSSQIMAAGVSQYANPNGKAYQPNWVISLPGGNTKTITMNSAGAEQNLENALLYQMGVVARSSTSSVAGLTSDQTKAIRSAMMPDPNNHKRYTFNPAALAKTTQGKYKVQKQQPDGSWASAYITASNDASARAIVNSDQSIAWDTSTKAWTDFADASGAIFDVTMSANGLNPQNLSGYSQYFQDGNTFDNKPTNRTIYNSFKNYSRNMLFGKLISLPVYDIPTN